MAASFGAYRVQVYYVETQCDISCDKTYENNIDNAYFDATTTPTVTFTFTPKVGYKIADIAADSKFSYGVTYEIIGGNKVKVTASSDVVSGNDSGNIEITVTTERNIKYLNDFGLAFFWNRIKAFFVPQTRKVNNKALVSDIALTAADVGAIPLAKADSFAKKLVKHYGKIFVGTGDTDKIEIHNTAVDYQGYVRFVACDIIGVSNIIDPSTGDEVFYGTIHVSSNFKPSGISDLHELPLEFRFRFKNEEDKTLLLKESLSQTGTRMMSFQGELKTGGEALDSVLEGVYADFNISNSENSSDKFVSARVSALQPIRGDKGYTYWIDALVPICWTYE